MFKSEPGSTVLVEPAEVGIRGDHCARVKSRVYGSSELVGEKPIPGKIHKRIY